METRERDSVMRALAARSKNWSKWFKFVDEKIAAGILPSPEATVRLLREYLFSEKVFGSEFLRVVRKYFVEKNAFEILMDFPLSGQGRVRISQSEHEWFGHDLSVSVGEATMARKWAVEAHEIGHLFYATLLDRNAFQNDFHTKRNAEAERFSWGFAGELLCPTSQRKLWNESYIKGLLNVTESQLVQKLEQAELRQLTYWHIRALAKKNHVSIRMVVNSLDRHNILNKFSYGIAVLKRMANPATGLDVGIRVWQRARPTWGYLALNQRAYKQGFSCAERVFEDGSSQTTVVCAEHLSLHVSKLKSRSKWHVQPIDTYCAYTPVDVKDEGRYILVIWPWIAP